VVPKKGDNPNVPISAQEIIEGIKRCDEIAITSVNVHDRRGDESPAWEEFYFEKIVSDIRGFDHNNMICVTTQMGLPFFRNVLIEELIYLDHSGGEIMQEFIQ
jgi:uncharacterized protein (DUF849 family)